MRTKTVLRPLSLLLLLTFSLQSILLASPGFPALANIEERHFIVITQIEGAGCAVIAAPAGIQDCRVHFKEEPSAVITVSDTGPGIPEECLAKLFSPFYTTKPEGVGNGLGLYLTRELVLKNKGQIKVSSFPLMGTSFTLEFGVIRSKVPKAGSLQEGSAAA